MAVRGVDYEIYRVFPPLEQNNIDYPNGGRVQMMWVCRSKDNSATVEASGYFNDMLGEFNIQDRLDIRTSDAGQIKGVVNSETGILPVTIYTGA